MRGFPFAGTTVENFSRRILTDLTAVKAVVTVGLISRVPLVWSWAKYRYFFCLADLCVFRAIFDPAWGGIARLSDFLAILGCFYLKFRF